MGKSWRKIINVKKHFMCRKMSKCLMSMANGGDIRIPIRSTSAVSVVLRVG